MTKFTEVKLKHKLGTVGDLVTEWMTPEEKENFWAEHNKHVEQLKKEGRYLEEVELTYKIGVDPYLDTNQKKGSPTESYRFDILDVGKL